MATVLCSKEAVVCIASNKLKLISTSNTDKGFEEARTKPAKPETDDAKGQSAEQGQSTASDGDPQHTSDGQILASKFSSSGRYFAVCDDYKQLTVWEAKNEWETSSTRIVPRKCVALAFNHKEDTIYVADKSGDVYSYSLNNSTEDGDLIVGHISMLLDVVVSPDDKYLITADRDEKIRVSHLPNAYNIQTFCLGHTQFVSRLSILPKMPSILVSGSGDGTVRLWKFTEGHQLHCISLNSKQQQRIENDRAESVEDDSSANGDSAGSGDSKTKEDKSTVSCVACSRVHCVVAVSLLNVPSVLIYQICQSDSADLKYNQLCTLDCEVPPSSLCFDDVGQLWVIRPVELQSLVVYSCSEENGKAEFKKLDSTICNSNTSKIVTKINENAEFFKDAFKQEHLYSNLHKKHIDNVSDYKERKHQREQFLKQKREAGQVKGQESAKKLKGK